MSSSEVVVANEEEVEHEQVTIHYISADGTPRESKLSFLMFNLE